jgi:hypothetical protein
MPQKVNFGYGKHHFTRSRGSQYLTPTCFIATYNGTPRSRLSFLSDEFACVDGVDAE